MTQKELIRRKIEEQMSNAKDTIIQCNNESNKKFGEGGLSYLSNIISFIDSLPDEEENIVEATIVSELKDSEWNSLYKAMTDRFKMDNVKIGDKIKVRICNGQQ